jgi:hypothetical protein
MGLRRDFVWSEAGRADIRPLQKSFRKTSRATSRDRKIDFPKFQISHSPVTNIEAFAAVILITKEPQRPDGECAEKCVCPDLLQRNIAAWMADA